MTKALRQMREDIRIVDMIIELVDARVPISSRNPDLDELGRDKARLILLNKADLADEVVSRYFIDTFSRKGHFVLEVNAKTRHGLGAIAKIVEQTCAEKRERDERRGINKRPIKAMVVGIPNVGKSTFINSYAGRAAAKTGNKPGITKGRQWIRLGKDLELLDTPGLLWPKFTDQAVGQKLAMIGTINENILDVGELSLMIIKFLGKFYPDSLANRYSIEPQRPIDGELESPSVILAKICESRHCYLKGGELHLTRAAAMIADDFRNGRLGRFSLDRPGE
jgi:ribosome biogenesis GTPase A